MTIDEEALREAAEAARSGSRQTVHGAPNATFIAAANPQVVLALLDELAELRARPARVLDEVAAEIEAELVCCDVFERRDTKARHHAICYWGGAARALVQSRAEAERNDVR